MKFPQKTLVIVFKYTQLYHLTYPDYDDMPGHLPNSLSRIRQYRNNSIYNNYLSVEKTIHHI